MAERKVNVETWACFECRQEIEVKILSSMHPEAPDLFTVPLGCLITCMTVVDEDDEDEDEDEGDERFIVLCNAKCGNKMLDDYDAPEQPDTP